MMQSQTVPAAATQPLVSSPSISPRGYAFLQKYIHTESGIVIEADKHYLLEARLLPIVQEHRISSLDALAIILERKSSSVLARLVIEAMTTNETLFFRDTAMFDALRQHVFPRLFELVGRKRRVRIWSAASSSGQEAFSLAMLLLEMGKTGRDVEILGTDLCTQMIARARHAKYAQFDVNRGLPASHLVKYFSRTGLEWQVKEEVRNMVSFDPLDLRRDFRFLGTFDLIFCRNVLIYFDPPTKTDIVGRLRTMLSPEAMLVLGCAETVNNVHAGFKRTPFGQSSFYSPI